MSSAIEDSRRAGKARRLFGMELAPVLTDEYSPFNIVCALHLRPAPSPEALSSAFRMLQLRHPLLSTRIEKVSGHYRYEPDPGHEIPLKRIGSGHPGRWHFEAEELLNLPIDRSRAPLVRAVLVTPSDPQHPATLLIALLHAIVDGASLGSLLHELLSILGFGGLDDADLTQLPVPPPVTELLPSGYQGLDLRARLAAFFARQMLDEVGYRWRTRGQRLATPEQGWCRVHPFSLSREETEGLVRGSRRRRIPLNAILSAALLLEAQQALYEKPCNALRYFTFADLRPYLEPPLPPQNLGSYLAMLRYTAKMPKDGSLEDLASQITRQILTSSKRGEKFLGALMSPNVIRMMVRYRMDRMGTTALSYAGPMTIAPRYGDIEVVGLNAFVSNFDLGPPLAAQTRILHGRLVVDLLFLETEFSRHEIGEIADRLKASLISFGSADDGGEGGANGTDS